MNAEDRKVWQKYVNDKYEGKIIKPKTEQAAAMIQGHLDETARIEQGSLLGGVKYFLVMKENGVAYRIPANNFFNLFNVEGMKGGRRRKTNRQRGRKTRTRRRRLLA